MPRHHIRRFNQHDDFLTPPEIVRSLGHFDLDPASSHKQTWKLADVEFKWPEQDGLMLPWQGRVWCNPPFSNIRQWIERLILHDNCIAIVPARLDTLWFSAIWRNARAVLLPVGRISYINLKAKSKAHIWGDAICAFGDNVEALRGCCTGGTLVINREIIPQKYPLTTIGNELRLPCAEEGASNGNYPERRRHSSEAEKSEAVREAEEQGQEKLFPDRQGNRSLERGENH